MTTPAPRSTDSGAIAIAPHGYAETSLPLNEIGVGYDGSPESEHALATARELANAAGAEIKALWVVSRQDVREAEPIPAVWPLVALGLVGDRADRLGELDGIAGEAVYGAPSEELSRFSSEPTCSSWALTRTARQGELSIAACRGISSGMPVSSAGAGTDCGGRRLGRPRGIACGRRHGPDTYAVSTDQDDRLIRMPPPALLPTLAL